MIYNNEFLYLLYSIYVSLVFCNTAVLTVWLGKKDAWLTFREHCVWDYCTCFVATKTTENCPEVSLSRCPLVSLLRMLTRSIKLR